MERLLLPEKYQLYESDKKIESTQILHGLSTTCRVKSTKEPTPTPTTDEPTPTPTTDEPILTPTAPIPTPSSEARPLADTLFRRLLWQISIVVGVHWLL